jgi:uracil-DNA glycosylase
VSSTLDALIPESWRDVLEAELQKPYFAQISAFLDQDRLEFEVYPPQELMFQALELCAPADVRVVILGQDPYHGPAQAHGLAFSVPVGVPLPPSLQNIFKERQTDLGHKVPQCGDLSLWAQRGVLLLNTALSVRAHVTGSHSKIGWQNWSDAILKYLGGSARPIAFVLWGNHARAKAPMIASHHLVLESAHPSPLSAHRGFLGSRPFSKVNAWLESQGLQAIDWSLQDSLLGDT